MSNPRRIPISFEPGFYKDATSYEAKGRYIDGDKIRFHDGRPEKIGGNVALNDADDLFLGICRAILSYQDFDTNPWTIIGTHIRLYQYDSVEWDRTNITPLEASGQLTNPFTTTNNSTTVNVTDTSHARVVGDYVFFDNASAVGGITIDGEYQVISVVDTDNYTITHSAAASSTAGPGGGTVDYEYELTSGSTDVALGGGYGVGGYGEGGYGEDQISFTFFTPPRQWHLDNYGENILALPTGGTVYQWDPDSPTTRAAAVTNAPTGEAMFVTSERVVVVLGADGDLMLVKWSDDDDITVWTAAATNIANSRRLQVGNRLVGGGRLAQRVNVIWSDTAIYLMQFTGASNVYDTRIIEAGCGLVGPKAFTVVNGTAFWWSTGAFKMFAGGQVLDVPRQLEIDQTILSELSELQGYKVSCHYVPKFNEVWWHYPDSDDGENTKYVAVCLDDFSWITGTTARTAFALRQATSPHVYATDEFGYIYEHETGVNDNGNSMPWSLTTGLFDIDDGNVSMNVWGYIPNMKRQTGDITLTLTSYNYPDSTTPTETKTVTIADGDEIVDFSMSGRHLKMSFSGTGVDCDVQFGQEAIEISDAGNLR